MLDIDTTARSRLAEDEYFRRKDAEMLHRAVLEWLPAVEVAWLDGADEAERHALRVHFNVDGRASAEGMALLDGWLTERPSDELFAVGRWALGAQFLTLGADEREVLLARVLALGEATGRAAGGYFGVGTVSSHERRHISVVQADLERPR